MLLQLNEDITTQYYQLSDLYLTCRRKQRHYRKKYHWLFDEKSVYSNQLDDVNIILRKIETGLNITLLVILIIYSLSIGA